MLLVNPYKSNDLASYQNEYIEEVLWVFNRLRMTDRTLESKYRKMTYKEFLTYLLDIVVVYYIHLFAFVVVSVIHMD